MNRAMERRVSDLEKNLVAKELRTIVLLFDQREGALEIDNGREPSLEDLDSADGVLVVTAPPWEPTLLRCLTDDELEEKYPGRMARLQSLKQRFPGAFSGEEMG